MIMLINILHPLSFCTVTFSDRQILIWYIFQVVCILKEMFFSKKKKWKICSEFKNDWKYLFISKSKRKAIFILRKTSLELKFLWSIFNPVICIKSKSMNRDYAVRDRLKREIKRNTVYFTLPDLRISLISVLSAF